MPAKPANAVRMVTAELFGGGPFDGRVIPRDPKLTAWPEFMDLGLDDSFTWLPSELRRAKLENPQGWRTSRRALYRFESRDGAARYVFDRRYNGDPGDANA